MLIVGLIAALTEKLSHALIYAHVWIITSTVVLAAIFTYSFGPVTFDFDGAVTGYIRSMVIFFGVRFLRWAFYERKKTA